MATFDIENMPEDGQISIMMNMALRDILNFEQTSRKFYNLSRSPKGDLVWKNKVEDRFPGASQFKSLNMTYRDMYIRFSKFFSNPIINFDPRNPPRNLDLYRLITRAFSYPSHVQEISPNADDEPSIIKYVIYLTERLLQNSRFTDNDRRFMYQDIWTMIIERLPDLEIAKWYYNNYHHKFEFFTGGIPSVYLWADVPVFKFRYLFSIMDKQLLKSELEDMLSPGTEDILPQETIDFLRITYNSL